VSAAALAARLADELAICATQGAGAPAPMVSMSMELLGDVPGSFAVSTSITRKTRTLVFVSADISAPDGARIATASSVHRVLAA
jgi:hypothetical protein